MQTAYQQLTHNIQNLLQKEDIVLTSENYENILFSVINRHNKALKKIDIEMCEKLYITGNKCTDNYILNHKTEFENYYNFVRNAQAQEIILILIMFKVDIHTNHFVIIDCKSFIERYKRFLNRFTQKQNIDGGTQFRLNLENIISKIYKLTNDKTKLEDHNRELKIQEDEKNKYQTPFACLLNK